MLRSSLCQLGAGRDRAVRAASRAGFTLLELLVVMLIIGTLAAILAPALGRTLGSARGFRCQMSLRQVSFDFSLFADEQLHGDRGEDGGRADRRFRLLTFQESLYGLDEYWSHGDHSTVVINEKTTDPPMRCTEIFGDLTLKRGLTAEQWGAIEPPARVSYGFNIRLHRSEHDYTSGIAVSNGRLESKALSSQVLTAGMTPLVWDVDGNEAFAAKGVLPQFSGPSLDARGFFADDMVWFPGARHNGQVNVAFIGGHVSSSSDPAAETQWRWDYEP